MIRPASAKILSLVALALLGLVGPATRLAAQNPPAGIGPSPVVKLRNMRALLHEFIDMKDFQAPMTLKEALGLIQDKLNAKFKEDDIFPILIDAEAFKAEDPDAPDVYDTQVKFPPFPRRMSVATALRLVLSRIQSPKAAFLLRNGFVEVTTAKEASLKRLLRQKVMTNFERFPLAEAIEELSAQTGVSVILDPRLGDKLKKPITAALNNDVPLEGVLRLLADMAEVKLFLGDDVIYITSPANAETLEKERKVRLKERWWEEDEKARRSKEATPPSSGAASRPALLLWASGSPDREVTGGGMRSVGWSQVR
jgi:hypothetical protein